MRIVILSDLHCGHQVGLTHPDFQQKPIRGHRQTAKVAEFQKQQWEWFYRAIKALRPIHKVIVNGDAIDGSGDRSGGTELITTDRLKQVDMAARAIEVTDAETYNFTFGTAYHTGNKEDYEDKLAQRFDGRIGSHEFINVKGWTLDCKHHLAGTTVPYGIHTPLAKEVLQNELWHSKGEQPKADVLIRSHVHKYAYCESEVGDRIVRAFSTPALQGYGSKYGARRCSGTINVGFMVIDIESKTEFAINPVMAHLPCMRAK